MRLECPRCGTHVVGTPGARVSCPQCGYAASVPLSSRAPVPPAAPAAIRPLGPPPRPLAATAARHAPPPANPALSGAIVNAFLPGVGTIREGRRGEGLLQLSLFLLGLATIVFLVGLAFVAGAWVWAVASSLVRSVHVSQDGAADAAP